MAGLHPCVDDEEPESPRLPALKWLHPHRPIRIRLAGSASPHLHPATSIHVAPSASGYLDPSLRTAPLPTRAKFLEEFAHCIGFLREREGRKSRLMAAALVAGALWRGRSGAGGATERTLRRLATSVDDIDDEEQDKEDNQDMRDPTPEPNELDQDIVESDLELDEEGIVQSDHDGVP